MCTCDQSSIFSAGGKFHPDYGLLLELHALTLVARSYALLLELKFYCLEMRVCTEDHLIKVHQFGKVGGEGGGEGGRWSSCAKNILFQNWTMEACK